MKVLLNGRYSFQDLDRPCQVFENAHIPFVADKNDVSFHLFCLIIVHFSSTLTDTIYTLKRAEKGFQTALVIIDFPSNEARCKKLFARLKESNSVR